MVQLNWNSDNTEGRFVLKNDQETSEVFFHIPNPDCNIKYWTVTRSSSPISIMSLCLYSETIKENCREKKDKGGVIQNFKRTLSKKEKKDKNKAKAADKAPGER